jgi:hypothetical protein
MVSARGRSCFHFTLNDGPALPNLRVFRKEMAGKGHPRAAAGIESGRERGGDLLGTAIISL